MKSAVMQEFKHVFAKEHITPTCEQNLSNLSNPPHRYGLLKGQWCSTCTHTPSQPMAIPHNWHCPIISNQPNANIVKSTLNLTYIYVIFMFFLRNLCIGHTNSFLGGRGVKLDASKKNYQPSCQPCVVMSTGNLWVTACSPRPLPTVNPYPCQGYGFTVGFRMGCDRFDRLQTRQGFIGGFGKPTAHV
jgi:hypothetical protein